MLLYTNKNEKFKQSANSYLKLALEKFLHQNVLLHARYISEEIFNVGFMVYMKQTKMSNTIYS